MFDKKLNFITKQIKRYFDFLFDTGYQIQSVDYHPNGFGNWEVTLGTDQSILQICQDREAILVYFLPLRGDRECRIELKAMIYFLSRGKIFIGPFKGNLSWGKKKQYEELGVLLRENLDKIVPFFGVNFNDYKNEIITAERDYFWMAVKSFNKKE